ncbi:MAG: hypothetical protein RIS80_1112 [Actinomycetota bacterium]
MDVDANLNVSKDSTHYLNLYRTLINEYKTKFEKLARLEELIMCIRAKENIDDIKLSLVREYIYARAPFYRHGHNKKTITDIVSKVDKQEAQNALNQAEKEIEQRYDFKGVGAEIDWSGEKLLMKASSEERVKAVLDVFQSKLVKRGISLKSLDAGAPFASGKEYRIEATLKNGIDQENAKKISKIIREEGPKSIKSQIQGDELRVSSKSRDDLQQVIALLKSSDLPIDVQFTNYR